MWSITGTSAELVVEGTQHAADGASQTFEGRVIAVAIEADAATPSPASTWLLVADHERPAPLWVQQHEVTGQRLGR